jgi:hypothetical protein
MATQGIVSVREHGEVVMKVVAGCDGYNAPIVAELLEEEWPVTPERAYEIAFREGLGDTRSLVVLTLGQTVYNGDEDIDPRYHETFADPNFNPRWENGTADFTEVIDVQPDVK